MIKAYERNPWGEQTVVVPSRIFWKDDEQRWYETTSTGPILCWQMNALYPAGPYDPGCTGSAWWWYAKMVPWLADALTKRYGRDVERPEKYAKLRHPGLRWIGKKPTDQLIRRQGISYAAILEYERLKGQQIRDEVAFMEGIAADQVLLDSRGAIRVILDALLRR